MSLEHQQEGHHKEEEPKPFYLATRFSGERPARQAYFEAQDLVFRTPDCGLSVFRFQLNRIYHVAVIGERPNSDLEQRLRDILSRGESASLPSGILTVLLTRRSHAITEGPWVERHHRPGKQL